MHRRLSRRHLLKNACSSGGACLLLASLGFVPACAAKDPHAFLKREKLGGIRLGQTGKEVSALLGPPASKGEDTAWAATGEWVQEWHYPNQGLHLNMASTQKGGDKTISSLTATAPCALATARGIRIGSTITEATQAYGAVKDQEQSTPGQTLVAGSVYGGILFTFTDGKVSQIFLGAAAE